MADQEQYQESNGTEQPQEQQIEAQETKEATQDENAAEQYGGDRINASKNDNDECKIFVGGLSWETTVKDLKDYFSKYGEIVDCTLKTDLQTGRSRGFGFVLYTTSEAVDKVCNDGPHVLHQRTIDPKRAKARGGKEPIKKVFVGGLDPELPETEIREYFGQFGKIEEIDLPFDKMKNTRRQFCFITYESESMVDMCCEKNKQTIGGKEVDVKKATPKNDGFGGGFGGGRGGGYGGRGGGFGGGRGRGRGGGGYGGGQGGYGNQGYDYNNYYNQGYNYDYYNQGYGNGYDYNNYYGQGGWGNQGYGNQNYGQGGGYGGYDYSGWYGNQQQGGPQQGGNGGYKAKNQRGGGGGYHPYQR